MLKSLFVKNYVLIDQLDLDFDNGFHVFTGETGAGKSIMVGALSLLLGNRADYSLIRQGQEFCEISAVFDISRNKEAQLWLQQQDIDIQEELELRRKISRDGKSKSWILSRPCSNASLKELGGMLVQIHGQHDQIKLNHPKYQLQIIDDSGSYSSQLEKLKQLADAYHQNRHQLDSLMRAGALSESESQLLQYQFEELQQLQLKSEELDDLHSLQKTLTHAVDTISGIESGLNLLNGNDSGGLTHDVSRLMQMLQSVQGIDVNGILQMLDEVSINLNEVESELQSKLEDIEVNPEKLSEVESRLDEIYQTSRKHKVPAEQLFDHYLELGSRLELNDSQKQQLHKIQSNIENIESEFNSLSQEVSESRVQHARQFSEKVTKIIQSLGLEKAQFQAVIEFDDTAPVHPSGKDRVSFEVIMNPGQSSQKVSKTASGGELSRIALAIEICKTEDQNPLSFVFDEVDAGIGGAVAETVGKLMRQLSQTQQVFAVTHLPQVAGLAHHHFFVSKSEQQGHTVSEVRSLNEMLRIQELARMLGGSQITETTLQQAKAFLLK